jgi:hypothetical protein
VIARGTRALTGPAGISLRAAAGELEQVYGTPIAYQPVSPDDAYRSMLDAGLHRRLAAVNKEYLTAYSAGWGDFTTPDFTDVVGHPGRSFGEFARDHAARSRAA